MDMAKATKKAPKKGAKAPRKSVHVKRWLFTLFDYDVNDPGDMIDTELVDYLIIGKEVCPTTGRPHLQGYACFKKEMRMTELKQVLNPKAHWTKADGTPLHNKNYCSKGEQPKDEWLLLKEKGPNFGKNAQVAEFGELPRHRGGCYDKTGRDEAKNEVCAKALEASTVHEGMLLLKKEMPYDYLRFGESMERNLKRAKTDAFIAPFEIAQFQRQALIFEKKSVLLWGPSNTGKTSYALAHFKNALLVSHVDKLKQLSPDNDGIVFDDMAFKHWPPESIIHLLDYDLPRDIHVRYGTVSIPQNTIKVFTHNTDNPFYDGDSVTEAQKEAIERRLQRIHVLKPLF